MDTSGAVTQLGLQRSQSVPPTSMAVGGVPTDGGYVFRAPPAAIAGSHTGHGLVAPLALEYGGMDGGFSAATGPAPMGGPPPPASCSSNMTLAELNTSLQRPSVSGASGRSDQLQGGGGGGVQEPPPPSVEADLGETLQALSECDDFSRLIMEVPENE